MTSPKPNWIILLTFCSFALSSRAQDLPRHQYRYFAGTILTGGGILFSNNQDGPISVQIPYTTTDASGHLSDSIFRSGPTKPYKYNKTFIVPINIEVGGFQDFFMVNFALSLIGDWASGFNLSAGYGRNFYIGPLVLKPSISIGYTEDGGSDNSAQLGHIDNLNKTITILGKTAGPTYDQTISSDWFDVTKTYNANTLDISFGQREWAFMPKLMISTNQYDHPWRIDLTVGYNMPFHEKGGILINQDGQTSHSKPLGGFNSLTTAGITTEYNNRTIHATPYQFNSLYISVGFTLVRSRFRRGRN